MKSAWHSPKEGGGGCKIEASPPSPFPIQQGLSRAPSTLPSLDFYSASTLEPFPSFHSTQMRTPSPNPINNSSTSPLPSHLICTRLAPSSPSFCPYQLDSTVIQCPRPSTSILDNGSSSRPCFSQNLVNDFLHQCDEADGFEGLLGPRLDCRQLFGFAAAATATITTTTARIGSAA